MRGLSRNDVDNPVVFRIIGEFREKSFDEPYPSMLQGITATWARGPKA